MTEPTSTPPTTDGTDISVDPDQLDRDHETPATSDPAEMTEDSSLGGVGGGNAGGAG